LAITAFGASSCSEDRAAPTSPVFKTDVAPILERRCVTCHAGAEAAGGWRASSFLEAIACVTSGDAATLPRDGRAPILRALDSTTHRGKTDAKERAVLVAWVTAGTPAFRAAVHPIGIVDPRSPDWHGKVLRERRWSPMLDSDDAAACGRCHDGTSSRPRGVTFAAPNATACTTCHAEPGGILACTTCHAEACPASTASTASARDACFFPARPAGAHAAHVNPSASHAAGLACSTCHPPVEAGGPRVIGGLHGNGAVEVTFDPAVVPLEASFDPRNGACAVTCHDRKGLRPRLAWSDPGPVGCNDCHSSPPAPHFAGPCTSCHREANASGTALTTASLHINGRVDVGDGSGKCGACHGQGDSPWPTTGAHAAHQNPKIAAPIACDACHVVPAAIAAAGHLDGKVTVTFSGAARARASRPTWNGTSCSSVACHGAKLGSGPAPTSDPVWNDTSGSASACGACHGIPPPEQHTPATSCDRSTCHGAVVTRATNGMPQIDPSRRSFHVDGVLDFGVP
jgi:predicted CxxxxCH...CXXCH cytochrome family protein